MDYPIGVLVFAALIALFMVYCTGRVFVKAGEPMWKAFVPVYSTYTLNKISLNSFIAMIALVIYIASAGISVASYQNSLTLTRSFGIKNNDPISKLFISDDEIGKDQLQLPASVQKINREFELKDAMNKARTYSALSSILGSISGIISVVSIIGLGLKFGKSGGFIILMLLFSPIALIILAFDSSDYGG